MSGICKPPLHSTITHICSGDNDNLATEIRNISRYKLGLGRCKAPRREIHAKHCAIVGRGRSEFVCFQGVRAYADDRDQVPAFILPARWIRSGFRLSYDRACLAERALRNLLGHVAIEARRVTCHSDIVARLFPASNQCCNEHQRSWTHAMPPEERCTASAEEILAHRKRQNTLAQRRRRERLKREVKAGKEQQVVDAKGSGDVALVCTPSSSANSAASQDFSSGFLDSLLLQWPLSTEDLGSDDLTSLDSVQSTLSYLEGESKPEW